MAFLIQHLLDNVWFISQAFFLDAIGGAPVHNKPQTVYSLIVEQRVRYVLLEHGNEVFLHD